MKIVPNKCCCKRKKGKKKKDNLVPALGKLSKHELNALDDFVKDYADFLDSARTPQQVVDYVEDKARENGFSDDQIFTNKNRSNIVLVKYGTKDVEDGLRILGAHVDSPCLHIKPKPIKKGPLGIRLDTQYYGGIYKYQWFDQVVRIVGHVVKNGKKIPIDFEGEILDIAPHISMKEMYSKKVSEAFDAEELDVLTGYADKEKLLKDLKIEERDFQRAELYVVPAEKTRVLQDLIVGYGHDDRVCVFTQIMALLKADPKYTSMVFGVDREEIGSTGITGAQAVFFEQVVDKVISKKTGRMLEEITQAYERDIFFKSKMLSADVDIATTFRNKKCVDPDTNTAAGNGLAISTYCGHGGKYEGNQVTAVFMDELITMFDKGKGVYQVSGLPSKVDSGGGGTIAKYFAQRGIETVDAGVPVAGMHSKTETIHKGDLYQAFKCFRIFLDAK